MAPRSRITAIIAAGLLALLWSACAARSGATEEPKHSDRCYPYLPAKGGRCPSSCRSIEDCAGSRGPADFEKNGWPLDCINGECVPLPPEAVGFGEE